ncbi:DUF222 domain-containing protein [Antrihabitans sp. YC3-6]|uniref:DUF222 domain-containing protein n=1 Tax=Antrihabitans stalagmiti TaxID=2799499 RepID=A0A934U6P1_9NOCA|nr:HNH endonuclease signature motif containing protein [Antrihabitans stalagmiti]MBJ8342662.1 DUF222 domain-containing protein [Antrihabitans stalagmiti]
MGLGELLDTIDGHVPIEPWRFTDTELANLVPALSASIHTLESIRIRLLTEAVERAIPQGRGANGAAAWLNNLTTSTSLRSAIRTAKLAAALTTDAGVAAAYHAGRISGDDAVLIISFLERPPTGMPEEAAAASRDYLIDTAAGGDTRDVRRAIARLEHIFDTDHTSAAEDVARNEFYASTSLNGRMAIKGDVDAETAEMLLAALSPLAAPHPNAATGDRDTRSAAQRRADAFAEILRRYLDSATGPTEGGDRPHLSVHINAADLIDHHTDTCAPNAADLSDPEQPQPDRLAYRQLFENTETGWMPWMGPLTVRSTRRLACDCVRTTIVLDEDGCPVDRGRTTRVVSKRLRKVVAARDHGCAFPGCGRPESWCDAHHVHHWVDGGPTDLDNLVLLCRFHHRLMHHTDWDVVMGTDRHPWFIPPAGIDPRRQPIPAHGRASPVAA